MFIHGYNVSFEAAVQRAAQISYDLQFNGATILYTWPSQAALLDYFADAETADWTVPHLAEFLAHATSRSGASTVHLLAHSMGNRALVHALESLASQRVAKQPLFGQVMLTAPDIDADIFRQKARRIVPTARNITLYASRNDRALNLAKRVRAGFPRAGDATPAPLIIEPIQTVDASAVDTDFLGHSYYGDNKSVLADVYRLLAGAPPGPRFGLRPELFEGRRYWVFVP